MSIFPLVPLDNSHSGNIGHIAENRPKTRFPLHDQQVPIPTPQNGHGLPLAYHWWDSGRFSDLRVCFIFPLVPLDAHPLFIAKGHIPTHFPSLKDGNGNPRYGNGEKL